MSGPVTAMAGVNGCHVPALCQRVTRVLGLVVILVALVTMVGWILDAPLLRNPFPGTVDMKFNTALGFLFLGIALILAPQNNDAAKQRMWLRWLARTLALSATAIGAITVAEYTFDFDTGFSQFFIQEAKGALLTVHLGRPAPITGVLFLLLGTALAHGRSNRWWIQSLPLIAIVGSLLALFGYIYQSPRFYAVVPQFTGIAVTTVLLFLVLTAGVFAAHPEHPVMVIVTNPSTGGILARRMLPTVVFLPLAAEVISNFGVGKLYSAHDQDVVHALLITIVLIYIVLRISHILSKVDNNRQLAEKRVTEDRNFIRTAIDSLPGIFYLITPDGHLGMWNRNFETVVGRSAEEMSCLHVLDLIKTEDREAVSRMIANVFTVGYAEIEAGLIAREGLCIGYLLTGQRLSDGDGVTLVGMGVDISARRRVENDLRAAKALAEDAYQNLKNTQDSLVQAEKMASLGGLVAGIAHEINTPVGIALTSASHLAMTTEKTAQLYAKGELAQADFEDYIQVAAEASRLLVSNCHRAAELIRSFKQVAVDQTGGERRSFHLKEYIDEVLLSLKPRLKKARHTVTVDCPSDIVLDTHPGPLSQSITNLVMNSLIHAFDEGVVGEITITVSTPTPDSVEIHYSDNGKGIPSEIQDKVFDPFFTTKRGDGGSGLGLHISYNAVCSGLKGSIVLDDAPNMGANFIIRIPRVLPAGQ